MANFIDEVAVKITIPNGAAVSNILLARGNYGSADIISMFGPAALDAHTFVIELTYDANPSAGGNWCHWNNGTSDIAPPGANVSISYPLPAATGMRIHDITGSVAAARTWNYLTRTNAY